MIKQKKIHNQEAQTNGITTETGNNTQENEKEEAKDNTKLSDFIKNNEQQENLGSDYRYDKKKGKLYYKNLIIPYGDKASFKILGKNYAKDKNHVYYKGAMLSHVETDKFQVIQANGTHKLKGIIVNSKNLLNHLKLKVNREFLMTTIASITNNNQNVKDELVQASAFAMDGFKSNYNELNNLQR
ncbi:MAG: hypothetical protein GXP45_08420 [bacterium]|nr:hypothetical protein [bacterium]